LEFLVIFYHTNFSTRANNQKTVEHVKNRTESTREQGQAGRPDPIGPEGLGSGLPPFFSGRASLTSMFGQKILGK
jgi:hypothetical protein